MNKKAKILIIKLGYSETLDVQISRIPSLGDVLRTTPILRALREKYPDAHITWLVSEEAEPLLHGNSLINRVIAWDEFTGFQLMREKFDILINLEKIPGICALSDMIDAWTRYGFRFDSANGTYHAYEQGMVFIEYLRDKKTGFRHKDYWQKILIEMLGVKWQEQKYLIGYKPKTREVFDVGLNYKIGLKWPTKIMPMDRWKELERKLSAAGLSVSWQEGLTDLCEYMDWMNSCRVIISHDSLGIHLAIALNKKAIGLFGPTAPQEIYTYGSSKIIHSQKKCPQMPCYSQQCLTGLNCMQDIDLSEVVKTAKGFRRAA